MVCKILAGSLRISVLLFAVEVSGCTYAQVIVAPWADYYCPRSNVTLRPGPALEGRQSFGSVTVVLEPFPKTAEEVNTDGHVRMHGGFLFEDCSTDAYLCWKVSGREGTVQTHYIFVPRILEPLKNYEFNGMHAVSGINVVSGVEMLPLTLWQKFGNKVVPITLTVQDRRGIVYWDGIDFWSSTQATAETCALTSGRGIFSEVRVRAPALPLPTSE